MILSAPTEKGTSIKSFNMLPLIVKNAGWGVKRSPSCVFK